MAEISQDALNALSRAVIERDELRKRLAALEAERPAAAPTPVHRLSPDVYRAMALVLVVGVAAYVLGLVTR